MAASPGRQTVRIYPLPAQIEPGDLAGGIAVVIDVLRASTTIIVALTNGATRVIPCGDVETARRLAAEDATGDTLTGGERGGVKIEGFDLDNSPATYSRHRVAGKTIIFTTTNRWSRPRVDRGLRESPGGRGDTPCGRAPRPPHLRRDGWTADL
jgi:hypothetical protein